MSIVSVIQIMYTLGQAVQILSNDPILDEIRYVYNKCVYSGYQSMLFKIVEKNCTIVFSIGATKKGTWLYCMQHLLFGTSKQSKLNYEQIDLDMTLFEENSIDQVKELCKQGVGINQLVKYFKKSMSVPSKNIIAVFTHDVQEL